MSVPRSAARLAACALFVAVSTHAEVTDLASRPFTTPTGYGGEADAASSVRPGAISDDGRWLVFSSKASNLVPGDTNGAEDVFLRDNQSGALVRVAEGREPVISGDGSTIAFTSDNALLGSDTNGVSDIYVVERATPGTRIRVSVNAFGSQGDGASFQPFLSANGQRVVFASASTNFTTAPDVDDNGFVDVFLHARSTGLTYRVSLGDAGQADGDSFDPVISADGLFVAFESNAGNLIGSVSDSDSDFDIFRRDLVQNLTEIVSIDEGLVPGNGDSYDPSISADGRFIAFHSTATNLSSSLDDNGSHDIYRRDMGVDGCVLVTRASDGSSGESGNAFSPVISADGDLVAFRSNQADLITGESYFDFEVYRRKMSSPAETIRIDPQGAGNSSDGAAYGVAMTADGAVIAFSSDADNLVATPEIVPSDVDVFVTTAIVAGDPDPVVAASASVGIPVPAGANAPSGAPSLSGDGRYVVFTSMASNLADDDRNEVSDVFRYDRSDDSVVRVSRGEGELLDPSYDGVVSSDGRWVAFATRADGIGDFFDFNGLPDIYVVDAENITSTQFELMSREDFFPARDVKRAGAKGFVSTGSFDPSMSADGNEVAFASDLQFLTMDPFNGRMNVYLRDRAGASTTRINVAGNGTPSSGEATEPAVSGDGNVVAFTSIATDLVAGDTNEARDVFVRDLVAGTTTRVSVATGGAASNGHSGKASLSFDGRYVAFESIASNLVAGGIGGANVYVHDRVTGETTRVSVSTLGEVAGGFAPRISDDGRFVAFKSSAINLGGPALPPGVQAYVHDRLRRATVWLSNDVSVFGDAASFEPALSRDGTRYALTSSSTNWVAAADGYRTGDVNVWTGNVSRTSLISISSDGPDPSVPGQAITVGYSLTASAGTPTGIATLTADSGETCDDLDVATPPASCEIIFATSGARVLTAYYAGDLLTFPAKSIDEVHQVDEPGEDTGLTGETPLIAPDGGEGDLAGSSVAATDDFVVMGAPNANDGAGAVYVFRRVTDTPIARDAKSIAGLVRAKDLAPVATLTGGSFGSKWGSAVGISPDGQSIVIGAPEASGGSGAAFTFQRPGSNWVDDASPDAMLTAPPADVGVGNKFGSAVAVGNGAMVAVGAPGAGGSGTAYVFDDTTQVGRLTPDPASADADTEFGSSLAMSGGTLVVGAPGANVAGRANSGAVQVYTATASGVSSNGTIVPSGSGIGDKWGSSVAIDGTTIVGGAPGAGGGDGAAFVFQGEPGSIAQRARLDGGANSAGSAAGMAVAVAGDYILVGAPLANVGGNANQGRAFVYVQPDSGWQDAQANGSIVSATGAQADQYALALALSRRGAVIGIPGRDIGLEGDQGQADSFVLDRIFRGTFE